MDAAREADRCRICTYCDPIETCFQPGRHDGTGGGRAMLQRDTYALRADAHRAGLNSEDSPLPHFASLPLPGRDAAVDPMFTSPNGRRVADGIRGAWRSIAAVYGTLAIFYGVVLALPHFGTTSLSVLLAIFAASAVASIGGFAFSALCGAILFHLVESPVSAVQIMLVSSISLQALSITALRSQLDWRVVGTFLAGGLVGLPFGVYLLLHLPHRLFSTLFGILLVAYGVVMLFRRPPRARMTHWLCDVAAGALGGITGGLAAFPGAFVTIWCGMKGWTKERQRGIYQPYILAMQVMTLLLIAVMNRPATTNTTFDPAILLYVPAVLGGGWIGLSFFLRMNDKQFAIAVNSLLVVAGLGLVY